MFSKSQERVIKIVYVLAFVLTFVPTNLLFVGWYPVSIGPNCKLESFIGLDVYPEHLALLNIDAGPLSPKIMSGVYIFLLERGGVGAKIWPNDKFSPAARTSSLYSISFWGKNINQEGGQKYEDQM